MADQAARSRSRFVGQLFRPSRWTPRGRRRARRLAFSVLVVWLLLTVASVSYNLATNHIPARPAGLTFVRAGDINTRYRTWGTAGSPIVLVPGAFETADTFAAVGANLGRDHRVFSLDLTGTGYSQARAPFTAGHLATQLLDFLTAMRLTGADAPLLVGHSSGAAVVGRAAVDRPGAVTAVMFLDGDAAPLPVPPVVGSLFIDPYRTTVFRLGLRSDWVVRQIYSSQCGPLCPRLNSAGVQLWRRPLQQSGTSQVLSSMVRHGIPTMTSAQLDTLRSLSIPKSVVFGSNDPQYNPTVPVKVAARIGAPAPILVPGRHLTMISSPEQVATAVRQLAARASSAVATGGAIGQASPAGNELNWVYRGTLPVESIGSIDGIAYGAWARKHGYQPAELLGVPLLGVSVPPGASVLLFDISKLTSNEGNLAAFVQSASGAHIVYDAPAVRTDSGIAVRVPIDGKPYVVALAAPGYTIVAVQSAGQAPRPMTAMTGAYTGTGWAVFVDPTPGSGLSVQVARCQNGTCSVAAAVPVR